MYISIVENRSGEEVLLRRLAPSECINPEYHAHKWANETGVTIAIANGYIPRGCADYYAEVRETKASTAVCWQSYDFYLED